MRFRIKEVRNNMIRHIIEVENTLVEVIEQKKLMYVHLRRMEEGRIIKVVTECEAEEEEMD